LSRFVLAVVVGSVVVVAGCGGSGGSSTTTTTATTAKTATALSAPFTFTVQGRNVTVAIDSAQGSPSTTDEPVSVVCANLGSSGFVDRDPATGTWPKGASSVSVTLPKSADGLDLCALSFTAHTGKQAAAFFNKQAEAKYLADQKSGK
jgi:hypothetical protein